jgi:hypothetical protein
MKENIRIMENAEKEKRESYRHGQKLNILDLSNELLLKIFAELGHDSLQSLLPQCRQIASLVRPMLWEKRKNVSGYIFT